MLPHPTWPNVPGLPGTALGQTESLYQSPAQRLARKRTKSIFGINMSERGLRGAIGAIGAMPPIQAGGGFQNFLNSFTAGLSGGTQAVNSYDKVQAAQQAADQKRQDAMIAQRRLGEAAQRDETRLGYEGQRVGMEQQRLNAPKTDTLPELLRIPVNQWGTYKDRYMSLHPSETAATGTGVGLMDEATLRMLALNYAKGGGLPALGLSKESAQAREKILNYAAHQFPALDVAGNKADLQKNTRALTDLQKLYDASTAFEATAISNSDVLLGTLKGIPDIPTRFGNKLGRFLASQFGSPQMSEFHTALETVKPEFARLLSSPGATGGLLTDTSRKEMSAVLSGDFTKAQLAHSLNILKRDAGNRRAAYSKQIDAIRSRIAWNQIGANPNFNVGGQSQSGGSANDPLGIR